MKRHLATAALLAVAACSPKPAAEKAADQPAAAPAATAAAGAPPVTLDPSIPAGTYEVDPAHSTLVFHLSHIGMSQYVAQFTKFSAQLQLDPKNPEAAQLTVKVDPQSLTLPTPPAGFKAELLGKNWLDAGRCPDISFRSTNLRKTGEFTADVTGDLTLHCTTKPVTLKAKFNGGYGQNAMDPNARIGFSATTAFKRSDFGVSAGIPAPGSNMGVGDELTVAIETEFLKPSGAPPAAH